MGFQTVFKRYEMKYIITHQQKQEILAAMHPYMQQDQYGRSVIRNLYYDTETYYLARHSNEKPIYKEKLRIRSYSQVSETDTVFVELKKKYDSVVYKRRMTLPQKEALAWIEEGRLPKNQTQIAQEIDYFRTFYGINRPAVFLSYEREAYALREGGDFRVTFDENILAKTNTFSLGGSIDGEPLLDPSLTLMELKASAGIPLWMTHAMTANQIYKTTFSKYGMAYICLILHKKGALQYA